MGAQLYLSNAREIFDRLLNQKPVQLKALSGGGGLYALEDELGVVRYIGQTGGSFVKRIYGYHCSGDDNSHKFSTVFNAGRLWNMSSVDVNPVKRTLYNTADGVISKKLRTLFARSRCRARIVNLPLLSKTARRVLEIEILAMVPSENKLWNDSRLLTAYEPEDGLDIFLANLSWPAAYIFAIERQKARWDSLAPRDRVVIRRPRGQERVP